MAKNVKVSKDGVHVASSGLSYIIRLPLDALLLMWAGHSFNQSWNWGQAFWLSFFYNGIISAINSLKE